MARGNGIFGIHINGINDRFQQTKYFGPNPFDYLALEYNQDGTTLKLYEWNGSQWQKYGDFDGYSLEKQRPREQWGKSSKLSNFYSVYNWNQDDGYNNFSDWVERVAPTPVN